MTGAARFVLLAVVVAAIAMSSTGCGTLVNLGSGVWDEKWPPLYGGVQKDADLLKSDSLPVPISGQGEGAGKAAWAIIGLYLADFPASFIGDTLTLPLVVGIYQIQMAIRKNSASQQPPVPSENQPATLENNAEPSATPLWESKSAAAVDCLSGKLKPYPRTLPDDEVAGFWTQLNVGKDGVAPSK